MLFSFEPKTEQNISLFLPWRCNTFVGSSPTQRSMNFFLKSDLEWAFSDIPIHIWIKYITRHFKRTNDREKILPWVWLEPTIYYFRAELQKYFLRFLVQVKIAKNPFEINWPLCIFRKIRPPSVNISKTIQMVKSHDISENDYSTTQALFLSKELYWVARCDFLQKFRQSQLDTFVRVVFWHIRENV